MIIENLTIGFLGAGKMGQAIASGLAERYPGLSLQGYDKNETMAFPPHLKRCSTPVELEEKSDVILLCVKPQDLKEASSSLKGDKKYISIAAGLSLKQIRSYLERPWDLQIARVMPNISALIGEGVSGYYTDSPELAAITDEIFGSVGLAIPVEKEELLHGVTGLSGSGPAFVFAFIHAMAEGGVLNGLSYDRALQMAARTIQGAASMVLKSGEHPSVLRNQVTSAGGTTIYGLKKLEEGGFSGTVMGAVEAARIRSEELGS